MTLMRLGKMAMVVGTDRKLLGGLLYWKGSVILYFANLHPYSRNVTKDKKYIIVIVLKQKMTVKCIFVAKPSLQKSYYFIYFCGRSAFFIILGLNSGRLI